MRIERRFTTECLMVRKALRKPAVMAALGITCNSSFYAKTKTGFIPAGTKLDPDGRVVVWWEDEIEAIQKAAVERAAAERGVSKTEAA